MLSVRKTNGRYSPAGSWWLLMESVVRGPGDAALLGKMVPVVAVSADCAGTKGREAMKQ